MKDDLFHRISIPSLMGIPYPSPGSFTSVDIPILLDDGKMSKINSMNKFPTFWGDENPWFPFVPSKNGPIDDAHHVVPEVLILATLHDTFPMPKEVKTVPWWNRSEPW
jgi:hypothetical protein